MMSYASPFPRASRRFSILPAHLRYTARTITHYSTLKRRIKYRTVYRTYSIHRISILPNYTLFKGFSGCTLYDLLSKFQAKLMADFASFLPFPEAFQKHRRHAVRIGYQRILAAAQAPVIHERPLPQRIGLDDLAGRAVRPQFSFFLPS